MVKCRICKEESTYLGEVNGYIAGTTYVIFECPKCQTQFILGDYDKRIYEIIYSAQGSFGYERYNRYAEQLKQQDKPLKWLSLQEPAYLYVHDYLKDKIANSNLSTLNILEIGCGEGYLTYAINQTGHECIGIDISMKAITEAIKRFGNYYQAIDLKDFKSDKKFDLIVCTETIEHLENPVSFVNDCLKHLKTNGKIILTTPNKDYRSPNTVWKTEAPPVHRFWLGHKSFEAIAKRNQLECRFLPLKMPLNMERNNLVAYWSSRGINQFGNVLDKEGKVIEAQPSSLRKVIRELVMSTPIRQICNLASRIEEPPTLGVLLETK